jgi:hypothetical protein
MYIHPKMVSQLTQYKFATTCWPVLQMSTQNIIKLVSRETNIRFLSSCFPTLVLIVEFIRLFLLVKYALVEE